MEVYLYLTLMVHFTNYNKEDFDGNDLWAELLSEQLFFINTRLLDTEEKT